MKRIWISMALAAAFLAACCGKVVVDGTAGAGGAGGAPASCPGPTPLDEEVKVLLGKPCTALDQTCASNNGCGGCSVTCKDGVWTSTDAELCFSLGGAC